MQRVAAKPAVPHRVRPHRVVAQQRHGGQTRDGRVHGKTFFFGGRRLFERAHHRHAVRVPRDGRPIISLFRGTRRPDPIEIHLLERHPLGSQAFMPLSQHDWLVVVAHGNTAGNAPDFSTLACFRASGEQGVSYDRGVWHHPLLVLQPVQDFLVIDRQGEGHNLDEVWHDGPAALIHP